jgi:hypothetical protein
MFMAGWGSFLGFSSRPLAAQANSDTQRPFFVYSTGFEGRARLAEDFSISGSLVCQGFAGYIRKQIPPTLAARWIARSVSTGGP